VLLSVLQEGMDNVELNTRVELRFSEAVDPATVSHASIQIREGTQFGFSVEGSYRTAGSAVFFEPALPGLCDLSDAGLKASTLYRIQCIGAPEEFCVRNLNGQPLNQTTTHEFSTRPENDPAKFLDPIPGTQPRVDTAASSPSDGDQAVAVGPGNQVVLAISENLDPCSVTEDSVRIHMYEHGGIGINVDMGNGRKSGFSDDGSDTGDPSDQAPADPYTWGATGSAPFSPPQKILASIALVQDFESTQILVTPEAGRFPENALVVVELTFDVEDFGGDPLEPFVMAFTTENLPRLAGTYDLENAGETPYDEAQTTADVNTARSPSLVQGFLLFSGDGDNGADPYARSLPQSNAPTCDQDYQANDSDPDHFDPSGDVLLDTGPTPNECVNAADGSYAVVFEFKTFRIASNVTVRLIGVNPAIILVQGDVLIESGGTLRARGDNKNGAPRGDGEGNKTATTTASCQGGIGVAGGGNGGTCLGANGSGSARYSGSGFQGYYHSSPNGPLAADVGLTKVGGAGHGNTSCYWQSQTGNNRNTPSGGGGGHATEGDDGTANGTGSSPTRLDLTPDGAGGEIYGDQTGRMLTPEAGSGGGAGAELRPFTSNVGRGPGGGGGAGGGFVDLTCGGDLQVLGTIDAAGGRGGHNPGGSFNPNYAWNPGTGGGGGGSGGGIRLLTPNDIILGSNTTITAAGGLGGAGGQSQGTPAPPLNNGGNGGAGRIAMEDGNSVISGLSGASVTPGEGDPGFYRSVFDATRFQGGGTTPWATTAVFAVGPLNPEYIEPVQAYGGQEDFVVGVPTGSSPGTGKTAIYVEARGYQMLSDGEPDFSGDPGTSTGWYSVGYFTDTTIDSQPAWNFGHPPLADIGGSLPTGNVGEGFVNLNTYEYVQLRFTIYLNSGLGATDPGPYLDLWTIRFESDQ
jgi:hypothetical protein